MTWKWDQSAGELTRDGAFVSKRIWDSGDRVLEVVE